VFAIALLVAVTGTAAAPQKNAGSYGKDEVPPEALAGWTATVLIEREVVASREGRIFQNEKHRGSGVIAKIYDHDDGREAIVVTNAHVVQCRQLMCRTRVGFGSGTAMVWSSRVERLATIPEKDLAVLRVRVPTRAEAGEARFASFQASSGDRRLFAVGWPDAWSRRRRVDERPKDRRRREKRVSEGRLIHTPLRFPFKSRFCSEPTAMKVLLHNAETMPGNSGGPIVDGRGIVVGLNTATLKSENQSGPSRTVHLAIPAEAIVEELNLVENTLVSLSFADVTISNSDSRTSDQIERRAERLVHSNADNDHGSDRSRPASKPLDPLNRVVCTTGPDSEK
jgi:S1-C subfamily serine protease